MLKNSIFTFKGACLFAILLMALSMSVQGAEGEKPSSADNAASAPGPAAAPPALSPLVTKVVQQSGSAGSLSQSTAWGGPGNPLDTLEGKKLAEVLLNASEKYGGLAKTVTGTVGDYVKEKQIYNVQQELTRNFYANFYRLTESLALNDDEYRDLVTRVAGIYIEDGKTGRYGLDAVNLRELPAVIKKEYADIVLARTSNGTVDTFHINGILKTRWNLKDGKPEGDVVTYYDDGEIRTIDIYKNGKKIIRKKYDREGKLEFEQNYSYDLPAEAVAVEKKEKEKPLPDGAMSELSSNFSGEKPDDLKVGSETRESLSSRSQEPVTQVAADTDKEGSRS